MKTENRKTIFVITPIGKRNSDIYKKFDAVFKNLIEPAAKMVDSGFNVVRADHVAKPGSFVKDILIKLKESFIVIANLSDLNPNVFYELGVRHTLSNRTIILTEDLTSLPSDLREYRALEYSTDFTEIDGFKKLLSNIISEIVKDPDHPDNPVHDRLGNLIKTREEQLLKEVQALSKNSKSINKKVNLESFDKRVRRILEIWKADRGGRISQEWDEMDSRGEITTKWIKEPIGDFNYYFVKDEEITNNFNDLEEYCLIIAVHNTEFNLDSDLADIRVMIENYDNIENIFYRFVIASDYITDSMIKKGEKFFKNALEKANVNGIMKYGLEFWDDSRLTKIEKELGLKI